ncbi:MAG: hypothetical protein H7249_02320 [Chitinophagaceae bacterium]|nr:hypothetical protein [Oligoflexus sp.]
MGKNSIEQDNGKTFVKNIGNFHPEDAIPDDRFPGSSTADLYAQAKALGLSDYQDMDRNHLKKAIESARNRRSNADVKN